MEEISILNGPCQVLPAISETTTEPAQCVKLRIPQHGTCLETMKPMSVPTLIINTATRYPRAIAYIYKDNDGKSVKVTYEEYLKNIRDCAKGFLHLGLERHNGVCILGFNSPEWIISNMGAIFAGGIASGIYATNSVEACYHCCDVSKANIVVVEDEHQCSKIQKIRQRLGLKAVIQYSGDPVYPDVLSWKQFMEIGAQQGEESLNNTLKKIAVNECCTLVFTSGTIGNPKAVMLSHDNLIYDSRAVYERIDIVQKKEVVVSYLPFSHIAAQIVDMYLVVTAAGTLVFADRDALKGSLVKTLQEARPTKFLAVPRVWEKIQEKMLAVGAQNGFLKKCIASWAKKTALEHNLKKLSGEQSSSIGYTIASNLILSKVKQALGLDRCNLFASAAAPLSTDIKEYFLSLDIPIMEAFGMSEASGAHTLSIPTAYNLNAIGMALPGCKMKVYNPEDGNGELCMYGRNIFMGYLNDTKNTQETIDAEGWLHSGDIGRIDDKGFVYITGRLKELLITAGGENIPPVPIEQKIQSALPNIGYAILIGDKRKYLSLLLTLKSGVNQETGEANGKLIPPVQSWLKNLGCPANTIQEVLNAGPDSKLLTAIQRGIDQVNAMATSNAQRIQKFRILPSDFSVASEELGPTMKVKRRIVTDKYKDIIESMYS